MQNLEQCQNNNESLANESEQDAIEIAWIERDDDDFSRRGTMYCFKSCQANQN